jgi:3-phosphoshikimate 1-carboxyvinyltransferase
MLIRPAKSINGSIVLPGDKSISHRAAMISAIAEGESRLDNFATSADCVSTLSCLRQLGVPIRQERTTVWVEGVGRSGFRKPTRPLDCGNSGTTMRLLAGLLAGQDFESELVGDESLMRRPMKRIAAPLIAMGAKVETTDGHAPVKISGRNSLNPIEYELPVASAQIKSCVLLAGLYASGETSVIEPSPTRDHTERMLRKFGCPIESENIGGSQFRHRVEGGRVLKANDIVVPGDVSAAAFFMVGAACLDGSDVSMQGVGMGAGRTGILGVLRSFGARLVMNDRSDPNSAGSQPESEPVGNIRTLGGFDPLTVPKDSISIGRLLIPNLIDEVPILAILGTQHEKGIEIRDAKELRVKETDRIAAVVENLRRMDAEVEEFEDGFRVRRSKLRGARVDSFGDHRIAMAFGIAGLLADGETEIDGAECAAVSFPGFFEVLESVVSR